MQSVCAGSLDLGALGVRTLKRAFSAKSISSHLLGNGKTRPKNCWDWNFDFWPEKTGLEDGASWEGNQNFGISIFLYKGPLLILDGGDCSFQAVFYWTDPKGSRGTPLGSREWKAKARHRVFFTNWAHLKYISKCFLYYAQFWFEKAFRPYGLVKIRPIGSVSRFEK